MAKPIAQAGNPPPSKPFTALPTSHALSFSGQPGTGGSSITHYKATIVDRPLGSAAALSSSTSQTPTINNIDQPGTVLVFLQVADDRFNDALTPDPWTHASNANYVSEANPKLAPDSAFVHVSVRTEHLDVEIPAAGQRKWKAQYRALVSAVEALKLEHGEHRIQDHDTEATGAQLDTLVGGGNADSLHSHATLSQKATTSTHGIIRLASAPADSANPKAITRHLVTLEQCVLTDNAKTIADGAEVFTFSVPNLSDYGQAKLRRVRMWWADGWNGTWNVYAMTSANWATGTFGSVVGSLAPDNSGARRYAEFVQAATSLSSNDIIVITHAAPTSTPGSPTKTIVAHVELEIQH